MKRNLIGIEWNVIEPSKKQYPLLPQISSVYLIVVKSACFKRRKIVYIGCTNNLRKRFGTHEILTKLIYNNTGYKLEIYYADIAGVDNWKIERDFINKHKPPFNFESKKDIKYTSDDFWRDMGVTSIRWRWNQYYPLPSIVN